MAGAWVRGARADPEQLFTLRVALASGSSDAQLEDAVRAVTEVASPQYGHYVRSQAQLREHWAPSPVALRAMQTFVAQLKKASKGTRMHAKESPLGDSWLLRMSVHTAEAAFQTEIYEYAHAKHKELLVLRPGDSYVVPVCIEDHVVYLDGLESFPTEMQANLMARSSGESSRAKVAVPDSSEVVSPALIRTQYDFPLANTSSNSTARTLESDVSASNKLVIGTFLHEFYTESDLKQFLDRYESSSQTIKYPAPKGDCIAGLPGSLGSQATGEASLDVQVAASLAHNGNIDVMCYTMLRDNARPMAADNQEPFLTFMQDVNAMDPPPSVVSISYTDDECSTPHGYMLAVNRELMKAAMKGISVIISAGDAGVQGSNMVESFCKIPACSQFNAMFPASSPYVTSVGATSLNFAKPIDSGDRFQEHVTSTRNGALITSGGGFSTVFPQPSYQQRAVESYLAKDSVQPLMSMFDSQGRAYPDIAALGHSFPVVTNGQMWPTDGTSVSAPIVASMVVIINEMLLKQGKPVLGFLNPLLYQLADVCPQVFQDVTRGDSACGGQAMSCCPTGHVATEGWDAVSGVGTLKVDTFVTHLQGCTDKIRLQAVQQDNQNIELQRQPVESWHRTEQQIEQLLFGAALIAGVVLASVLVSLRSRLFVDVCALDIRYPHHDRDAPAREHLLSGNQNV